jgi:hypothetical protein
MQQNRLYFVYQRNSGHIAWKTSVFDFRGYYDFYMFLRTPTTQVDLVSQLSLRLGELAKKHAHWRQLLERWTDTLRWWRESQPFISTDRLKSLHSLNLWCIYQ